MSSRSAVDGRYLLCCSHNLKLEAFFYMLKSGINIGLDALPEEIPIFPLTGALLLPGGQLPLHIFEPRYLAMVDAALESGRWFGMVQPQQTNTETWRGAGGDLAQYS